MNAHPETPHRIGIGGAEELLFKPGDYTVTTVLIDTTAGDEQPVAYFHEWECPPLNQWDVVSYDGKDYVYKERRLRIGKALHEVRVEIVIYQAEWQRRAQQQMKGQQ